MHLLDDLFGLGRLIGRHSRIWNGYTWVHVHHEKGDKMPLASAPRNTANFKNTILTTKKYYQLHNLLSYW
jgi:hypothetical protein